MFNKLAYDALAADLAAVNALLESRSEEDDPIGYFQYSARRDAIQNELQRMKFQEIENVETICIPMYFVS